MGFNSAFKRLKVASLLNRCYFLSQRFKPLVRPDPYKAVSVVTDKTARSEFCSFVTASGEAPACDTDAVLFVVVKVLLIE